MLGARHRPANVTCLWVVALAVTAAGCGPGNTQASFISRADAICSAATRAARALPPPAPQASANSSLRTLGAYLSRVTPIVDKEVADVRALPIPTEDRATLERYLAALSASAGQYRALAAAASRGDVAQATRVETALAASPAVVLAHRYGLRDCSSAEATTP